MKGRGTDKKIGRSLSCSFRLLRQQPTFSAWESVGRRRENGVATRCHPAKQGAKKRKSLLSPFGASSMSSILLQPNFFGRG